MIFWRSSRKQLRALHPLLDDQQELRVVPGLLQILEERDLVDGLDGAGLVGVAGEQYTGGFRLQPLGLGEELNAVQAGHHVVGDGDVHRDGSPGAGRRRRGW